MNDNNFLDYEVIFADSQKWNEYMEYDEVYKDEFYIQHDSNINYDPYNWKVVYPDDEFIEHDRILVSEEYKLRKEASFRNY